MCRIIKRYVHPLYHAHLNCFIQNVFMIGQPLVGLKNVIHRASQDYVTVNANISNTFINPRDLEHLYTLLVGKTTHLKQLWSY